MINIFLFNEKEWNNYAENIGHYRTKIVVRDLCTAALKQFITLESVINWDKKEANYIPRNWSHRTGTHTYDTLAGYWPTIDSSIEGGDFGKSDRRSRKKKTDKYTYTNVLSTYSCENPLNFCSVFPRCSCFFTALPRISWQQIYPSLYSLHEAISENLVTGTVFQYFLIKHMYEFYEQWNFY